MGERETTTRAYTLKLQCLKPEDKKKLWLTHEAVNKGAKVFGDWLLTLRGGLSHELADKHEDGTKVTDMERKNRRIMLALSWLSVESKIGALDKFIVATGEDAEGTRIKRVVDALEEILYKYELKEKEVQSWIIDCEPSLSAAIRTDAVWVNRSAVFNNKAKWFTQEDIWDMLEYFFNGPDSYLAREMNVKEQEQFDELETPPAKTEKVKDMVQKAGNWLSKRFGEGKGTDFKSFVEIYKVIAEWAAGSVRCTSLESALPNLIKSMKKFDIESENIAGVQGVISGPGYKSGTKTLLKTLHGKKIMGKEDWKKLEEKAQVDVVKSNNKNKKGKGAKPYSNAIKSEVEIHCGINYLQKDGPSRHKEYCVILDHAARRVALAHTWIKKAEAERRRFEEDASCKENIDKKIIRWLDSYCENRAINSGSEIPVRIRRRAIDGWEEVVKAWSKKACDTVQKRIDAARELQPEIDKFGDIQLFEALAEDEAKIVWFNENKADANALKLYVRFKEAEAKKREFKVPAYRHPDMLLHPVFCDFGYSRWDITYLLHNDKVAIDPKDYRNIKLKLFDGIGLTEIDFKWQSKKFMSDIAATFQNAGKAVMGCRLLTFPLRAPGLYMHWP
jgi:hypothetical protein